MYGTIARMRIKPGNEQKMVEMDRFQAERHGSGFVASYAYHMDNDPQEYYIAVVYESRAAYRAFSESPEQNSSYQEWVQLLESPPEWHDGEIVSALPAG